MPDNKKALDQFITKTENIQSMLKRIQKEVDNHFGYSPEDIDYTHVGDLDYYETQLEDIIDCILPAGEKYEP